MATVDLLVASSPLRFAGCHVAAMSSSPVFPSPSALVRKRPQLKSGSRAAPNLPCATLSVTTAAHLLNEPQFTEAATATKGPSVDEAAKTKFSGKPQASKDVDELGQLTAKKPRKPRTKKAGVDAEAGDARAEKPPRKPRAKKDVTEVQAKIPKGKITKSSVGSRAEKGAGKGKTGAVSSHFASAAVGLVGTSNILKSSENEMLLQEAVRRRKSWTPPKVVADPSNTTIPRPETIGVAPGLPTASGDKQKTITDLFGKYGYNNGGDRNVPERSTDQPKTRKRKLTELVKTNNAAVEPPIAKVKAVRKKPRTITELATSAYAVVDEVDLGVSPAPLLQYFSYEDSLLEDDGPGITDEFKVPPKPRSKSSLKTSLKASKAKKGTAEAPILLSPQTALKRVEKQEFIFGTSSQLAREDSPTLLRDLQQAMQASNQIKDDPFAGIAGGVSPSKFASATEGGTELYIAKRNLWAAASRGNEGALETIETVDMSESPQVSMLAKPSVPLSAQHEVVSDSKLIPVNNDWHDLDEDGHFIKEKSNVANLASSKVGPVEAAIRLELLSSPAEANDTGRPSCFKPNSTASKKPPTTESLSKISSTTQKPDYGSYATAQLAKEIASYHFKPVKSRNQMIALLEKCWEGKQKVTANNTQEAQEAKIPDTSKPLVLRQTPKKQKKKASPIPEEIYDSDSPLTPSPPRRRTKVRTPPPPLQLSVPTDPDESLVLSLTSQQARLHEHITRAITRAPPSTDSQSPSWHEKILLYDPIVLEDLATWLNTGALERVGWDGEVDPKEVKKWCLEKSICCLWRENLRGAARSRY